MAKKSTSARNANKKSASGSFGLATKILGMSHEELEQQMEKARQGFAASITAMKEENQQLWAAVKFPVPPALLELKDRYEARLERLSAMKDDVNKAILAQEDSEAAVQEQRQIRDQLTAVMLERAQQRRVEKIATLASGVTKELDAPPAAAFRKKPPAATP